MRLIDVTYTFSSPLKVGWHHMEMTGVRDQLGKEMTEKPSLSGAVLRRNQGLRRNFADAPPLRVSAPLMSLEGDERL